jgi:hypothetical protein
MHRIHVFSSLPLSRKVRDARLAVQPSIAWEPVQVELVVGQCSREQVGEREDSERNAGQSESGRHCVASPLDNLSKVIRRADVLKHTWQKTSQQTGRTRE